MLDEPEDGLTGVCCLYKSREDNVTRVLIPLVLVASASFLSAQARKSGDLSAKVAALEGQIREMQFNLWMANEKSKNVEFDPTDLKGFGLVKSNNGDFLISVKSVDPYLDGVKVTLRVGNMYNADFVGCRFDVKWGSKPPSGFNGYSDWMKSLQEKSVSIVDRIRAGRWTEVSFVLSPAAPSRFGYMTISMTTDVVGLM